MGVPGDVPDVVDLPHPARPAACVALTSAGLYVPFSLQVTLGQDCPPSRAGTAAGTTPGPAVSVGGPASALIGRLADATTPRSALTPLVLMLALSWLMLRTLPEPATPPPPTAIPAEGAEKRPERAGKKPERAGKRPERAGKKPERAGKSDETRPHPTAPPR
ncbi:hypothetical protein [Streptomyces sp. NPDC054783]